MEKYYVINHLVLMSGLSDRTIRNYLASGILQGEKINGLWHFTPEQVEAFICHPAVRPSILTKHHAQVFDFLANDRKKVCESCVIVDFPEHQRKEVAEYFCYRISTEPFHNIRFSFDGAGTPRVILSGDTQEVLRLINDFMRKGS